MPMTLLRKLAESPMPATVTDLGNIMQLRILRAAGHVLAKVPLPRPEGWHWRQDPATVYSVTPLGLKVLRWFGPSDLQAPEKDREH